MAAADPPPTRRLADLRRRPAAPVPPPAAAPARPAARPPAAAGPPLPVGRPAALTDLERSGLAALGVPTDRPPPPGLADEIARVRAADPDRFEAGLPAGVPADHRLAVPPETSVADLPPEHRRAIADFVTRAASDRELEAAVAAARVPGAGAGVNAAIETVLRAGGGRAVPVDATLDADPLGVKAAAPPPPGPADPPDPGRAAPAGEAGGLPAVTHCPHCNWDLARPDGVEITPADKAAYLATVLGGTRFRKEIRLLGGRLVVGFRTLTVEEADLAYRQTVIDGQALVSTLPSGEELWGNLISYRLAMGIEYVESAARGRTEIAPIDETEVDAPTPPNTRLRPFFNAVVRAVLPTDQLRRIVGDAYHLFMHQVEKMDAMAVDPNFWEAIGG